VTSAGVVSLVPSLPTSIIVPTLMPCRKSSRALNDSHCFPAASMASTGWPATTFSPTSATLTLTTPSAGACSLVFASLRSSNCERGRRGFDLRVGDIALLPRRAGDRRGVVGLRLGDVGARARRVVLGLVQRLLRSSIAARQIRGAVELLLCILQSRFRLRDRSRQCIDLLGAHAGVDVVAVGLRGIKGRARLYHCRAQLERGKFGDHVTGADAISLVDFDRRELATDFGRYADLGPAHEADNGRGLAARPQHVCARPRGDENETKRNNPSAAASHACASV
jgi:hypothetical protein